MADPVLTVGRRVNYVLTAADAEAIMRRRTNGRSIAQRMALAVVVGHSPDGGAVRGWPEGAQAHIGNPSYPGDVRPFDIVALNHDGTVNGRAMLDGTDDYWATGIFE